MKSKSKSESKPMLGADFVIAILLAIGFALFYRLLFSPLGIIIIPALMVAGWFYRSPRFQQHFSETKAHRLCERIYHRIPNPIWRYALYGLLLTPVAALLFRISYFVAG